MPIVNHTTATAERLALAAAHLRQAILLIEEVAPGIIEGLTPGAVAELPQPLVSPDQQATPSGNGTGRPPIADRATYCAQWANQTCYLGNTMSFRLLERLARRPNQLVPCDSLLEELWDQYSRSREVLRAAVKLLR